MCEYWLLCSVACEKPHHASKHCSLSGLKILYLAVAKDLCWGFLIFLLLHHTIDPSAVAQWLSLALHCHGQVVLWPKLGGFLSDTAQTLGSQRIHFIYSEKKQGMVIAALQLQNNPQRRETLDKLTYMYQCVSSGVRCLCVNCWVFQHSRSGAVHLFGKNQHLQD